MSKDEIPTTPAEQNREDLAWAAGLFEGEGCVFRRRDRGAVVASVTMTDRDRIEKLAAVLGVGTVLYVKPQKAGWKEAWKWATSSREGVEQVYELLHPWLGPRRLAAFESAIGEARRRPHARRLRKTCECGFATTAGPMGMHQKHTGHSTT